MQTVTPDLVKGKKVLLRYDLDVPLRQAQGHGQLRVEEDFRLKAGLPTLRLCLEYATQVIIMGHIGRPQGEDLSLSVAPIYQWLLENGFRSELESKKLRLLENLRFEKGEEDCDINYAKELAQLGEVYINEAFAAHHKAASTTVLPSFLPHAFGLNFTKEVQRLSEIKNNPKKPLVVIIGGVKIEDKLPVVTEMAKVADSVLVGGKIVQEITDNSAIVQPNVFLGRLTADGLDITQTTIDEWVRIIRNARMIVWNGPVGKADNQESKGTYQIAQAILQSSAEVIIGGGDTISFLGDAGLLEPLKTKPNVFISTGGGAMLKFLSNSTLATIDALS